MDNPAIITNKGSILAIVLWSLCLLTTFTLYLGFGVRQKIIAVKRLDARRRLHFVAEAGIKRAILELKKEDETDEFDALNESWSNNIGIFKDVQLGSGRFTVSYGYLNRESDEREVRYGIIDEERKININKAEQKVIKRLFKIVGLDEMEAQNLSASIVDWRDKDSELSIPLGSAEDRYYRNLKDPYEAKDADFEVLDELLLVRGMNRGLFNKIKDFITIYGDGKININTVSGEVLLALGLHKSVVGKILSFRYGNDLIEATFDDNVFYSPSTIVAKLSQFSSLSASDVASLSNLISVGGIDTDSYNFMIKSIGKLDNRDASLKIVCVFGYPSGDSDEGDSDEGNSDESRKIRYWREKPN